VHRLAESGGDVVVSSQRVIRQPSRAAVRHGRGCCQGVANRGEFR
jgi:hypothetical protein